MAHRNPYFQLNRGVDIAYFPEERAFAATFWSLTVAVCMYKLWLTRIRNQKVFESRCS